MPPDDTYADSSRGPAAGPQTDEPGRKAEAPSASTGVSQFLAKVLEQLNLSSWLPAAMLVCNTAVIAQLQLRPNLDLAGAIKALIDKPLGILVVLLFSLVLAAIVVQAFEFEFIRLLEGYVDTTWWPIRSLIRWRINHHTKRRDALEQAYRVASQEAFMVTRHRILENKLDYPTALLEVAEARIFGRDEPAGTSSELRRESQEFNWQQHATPQLQHLLDSLRARRQAYPARGRVLPTRLGNVLRASEDKLELEAHEELETFVIRHHDRLPQRLQDEHRDYRQRLDMYCSLTLVFCVLVLVSGATLYRALAGWLHVAVVVSYIVMAAVSYEAAIASARGYGGMLREINRHVLTTRASGGSS